MLHQEVVECNHVQIVSNSGNRVKKENNMMLLLRMTKTLGKNKIGRIILLLLMVINKKVRMKVKKLDHNSEDHGEFKQYTYCIYFPLFTINADFISILFVLFVRCFEVLGYDIMLDSNLNPWIIEVNHLPRYVLYSLYHITMRPLSADLAVSTLICCCLLFTAMVL